MLPSKTTELNIQMAEHGFESWFLSILKEHKSRQGYNPVILFNTPPSVYQKLDEPRSWRTAEKELK